MLTAITTAQNTRGVSAIENLTPGIIRAQIDAVLFDIDVKAIKVGIVSTDRDDRYHCCRIAGLAPARRA